MRLREPATLLLLLAHLLLAGCSDGGGGGGPPVASTGPAPVTSGPSPTPTPPPQPFVVDLLPDFAFEACRGISLQSTRPVAEVQALLPDGFTAAPAPFAADGAGLVAMDLYACGNLTTPNARIADVAFGQVYTRVQRPVERVPGAPEAAVHEYAFRLLAGDDVLARLWPSAGYDTRNGTASVTVAPPAGGLPADPGVRLGDGSVGDDYRVVASGSPPAVPIPSPGTFARYTALSDGSVLVWTGAYSFPGGFAGQGSFDVAPDDVFAGFEQADGIPGLARLFESGDIVDQDLRRFF